MQFLKQYEVMKPEVKVVLDPRWTCKVILLQVRVNKQNTVNGRECETALKNCTHLALLEHVGDAVHGAGLRVLVHGGGHRPLAGHAAAATALPVAAAPPTHVATVAVRVDLG